MDTGATSSLIKISVCRLLNVQIHPTLHRAIQLDGADLEILGEVHFIVTRGKLSLSFNALVVKNMATDILAGTGFHKENDIYSRLATDKIVVQGKYYFNSTPPMALTAKIETKTSLPEPFTYPILVKANKSATILPGEGFHVPVFSKEHNQTVEIEPRIEAPKGFTTTHLTDIFRGEVFIKNMSCEPIKIKKNTPICQIRETRVVELDQNRLNTTLPDEVTVDDPLVKVTLDPANRFSPQEKETILKILGENKIIFDSNLPGYNHFYGRVEATFQWASPSRPPTNRARIPNYNSQGTALYNLKVKELARLGVLRKCTDIDIQPAFKNNSFLVKKQSVASKSWDKCHLNDVRLVTAFSQLQSYILTIPAKVLKLDRILQACANWNHMAELDMSNMFYQIPLKRSTNADLKKLSYLCIQTDEGTYVYVRSPQGLPGI